MCSSDLEDIAPIAKARGLKVGVAYGGVSINEQAKGAAKAHILIATPGRLLDLHEQKILDLRSIQILIMDEVDRMLDMGFIEDVTRIVNYCPKQRQTLLFSATISEAIGRIAGWALKDPVTVDVRTGLGAADTVDHAIYPVDVFQKYDLLQIGRAHV